MKPFLLLVGLAAFAPGVRANEPWPVAVSVLPQAGIVERVGGDRVEVMVLADEGADPHSFSPSAKRVTQLSQSAIWFTVGMPFEEPLVEAMKSRSDGPRIRSVGAEALGVGGEGGHGHGDHDHPGHAPEKHGHEHGEHEHDHGEHDHDHGETDHDHGEHDHDHGEHDHDHGEHDHGEHDHGEHEHHDHNHGEWDPHVWLSPVLLGAQAHVVAHALAELDPDHAAEYEANAEAVEIEALELDGELAETLAPLEGTRFYVFHPAFGYFAKAYGLKQISIETGGREPSAKQLTELISQAREDDVRLILVQPQFQQRGASRIARAIGASLEEVDPLAPDAFATMRRLAEVLRTAR